MISIKNKLGVMVTVGWLVILLSMSLVRAWQHDWILLFWVGLFVLTLTATYSKNLNVTIVNNIYNVDEPPKPKSKSTSTGGGSE